MEKKYVEINNLIALYHIVDDYEEFEKRLKMAISPKYNRDFTLKLLDISQGKSRAFSKKEKRFYNENKSVIDTINKYSSIDVFIDSIYGWYGSIQFFYEYFLSHKEDLDRITKLLEKMKQLGFDVFTFDEDLDFTKETYGVFPTFRRNSRIIYVDNIEVIPSYTGDIDYKTTSSNYKMELDIMGDEISKYRKRITLNSLLFDPNRLPESLTKENTFDNILKLKSDQKEKSAAIRNSVDLSISILDLEEQLSSTGNVISKLEDIQNKSQLLEALLNIKGEVDKLKTLSEQYDSSISEKEQSLTKEVLNREKKLQLKRIELSKLDFG